MHVEFLVEEESCARALDVLVPKILGATVSFGMHAFQGKADLLKALPQRLRGYKLWVPNDWRIVVLIDRDDDDCKELKDALEKSALDAGFRTKSSSGKGQFEVLTRIAIEELEAWFLGDVPALTAAYPKVPPSLSEKRGFRDCDAISGGTWEALERVLKRAGYYGAGMPKVEVARNVAGKMDIERNRSRSFRAFCDGLRSIKV